MTAKLKHRDFDIEFDVATEEWRCGAMALANKSLSALKTMIDREGKKRRQVDIEVLYLHENYVHNASNYVYTIKRAVITLLLENSRQARIKINGARLTEQVDLGDLYPLDDRKKLEAFIDAKEVAAKAEQAASELQEALSPLTADAVREAVVRKADEAA